MSAADTEHGRIAMRPYKGLVVIRARICAAEEGREGRGRLGGVSDGLEAAGAEGGVAAVWSTAT